jgi:hypothetical protein
MCSKRSEIIFERNRKSNNFYFSLQDVTQTGCRSTVAVAKYYLKSKENYEDVDRKVRNYGSIEKSIY